MGAGSPESIVHELSELWASLGKQAEEGSAGVLRSCSMTLLVLAEERDDPQAIGETLAALMPEHPSRAIVIRVRPSDERSISSRVFAQCWKPFGHQRQICCEQVEIEVSEVALAEVPPVVLPLVIPDLPVVLWCRSPRLFEMPFFPQLAVLAQKVLIDSEAFSDARAILGRMAEWAVSGHSLGDLAWTRLTCWRELVSQVFDNPVYLASLPDVRQVRIGYPGDAPDTAAWYLGAWLIDGIGKAGGSAELSFERSEAKRVDLLAGNGHPMRVSLSLLEGHTAEVRIEPVVNRVVFSPCTDLGLIREELSITGHDSIYERTLAEAAGLALSR